MGNSNTDDCLDPTTTRHGIGCQSKTTILEHVRDPLREYVIPTPQTVGDEDGHHHLR